MLFYERPPADTLDKAMNYYEPSEHLAERYRQRMVEKKTHKRTINSIMNATNQELGYRANYMLLFSIHGRPGETEDTEVRYYFNWEIVVDNKRKRIVTMYEVKEKKKLPAHLFGRPAERNSIYKSWFRKRNE